MASLLLDDFSGGLNLRDSPNQLKPSESPDCINWALDERGGLVLRKGCANVGTLPGVSLKKPDIFYSAALDQFLCARETSGAPNTLKLFTSPTGATGTWTDRGTINSVVTARAGFVDFPGNPPKVVLCTNVNSGAVKGIFTWDGTTLTDVAAGDAVCGDGLALWQDRVYVIGYPVSDANGNPTLMRWCDPKDPTAWTSTNVQQFRELNANPLTGIAVVGGGLVVFKKRSSYRVNDAATGAYVTLDSAAGCANPRAIASTRGRLYVWGADAMYECDGAGPLKNVGDKIRPVYLATGTDAASIVAAVHEGKALFAGSMAGGIESKPVLEFSPDQRWLVQHTIVGSQVPSSMTTKDGVVYGAMDSTNSLYKLFTESPGSDPIDVYTGGWDTPWLQPNSGMLARLQRARVQGLLQQLQSNTASVVVIKDWDPTTGLTYDITSALRQSASAEVHRTADIQSLGHGYSFQLQIIAGGAIGTAVIRAIQLIDTPLQWPSPGYPRRDSATPPPPPPPPIQ